jgi:ABC-type Fe3+ transport system permease subunit
MFEHIHGRHCMNAEIWASIATVVATVLLVVVPGVVYAWYVLEEWIGREDRYPNV